MYIVVNISSFNSMLYTYFLYKMSYAGGYLFYYLYIFYLNSSIFPKGDLMGPSINGLESLIKMPYGCGEQNMLNFAPNIFVTRYLEITNNLDTATFEKSKNYMKKGEDNKPYLRITNSRTSPVTAHTSVCWQESMFLDTKTVLQFELHFLFM